MVTRLAYLSSTVSPPQLDDLETTAGNELPDCYSDYKRASVHHEFVAARMLYDELDCKDGTHRTESLLDCRKFAWFVRHKDTGMVKVVSNACRLRWCPICSNVRYVQIRRAVQDWIQSISQPKFITLTLLHTARPLADQIASLYRAFRLLRQRNKISRKIRGGVWFFQITRNRKTLDWHPHLHVLVDASFIAKEVLSQEWFLATGNSYIIDIRAIKDPRKVVDYVSRYCARPCRLSDYEEADRLEIATVLFGKRLCGSFGTGVKCHLTAGPPEDCAAWERLGSWRDIVSNRLYEPVFAQIVKSWLSGRSLERGLCEHLIRQSYAEQVHPLTVQRPVSSRQLCFEDFVHL
jgi:hypothetical protein